MRKLFKKTVALSMAAVMTLGTAGVVSARVADGTNVAGNVKWTGFSVLTDDAKWASEDKTCKTKGQLTGSQSANSFNMSVENSGWDGNWNTHTTPAVLASDMPWGLTVTSTTIPVEAGRSYTVSYKIKSTLSATYTDPTTKKKEAVNTKQIQCKVYTQDLGDPAIDLDSYSGCDKEGYVVLEKDKEQTVTATFTVKSDYKKGTVAVKYALGAYLKTRPKEVGMKGAVSVSDFKVTANPQHAVTFKDGSSTKTSYVNEGATVASVKAAKKGYTFVGWYTSNGQKFNFNSKITADVTLTAKWAKTTAPKKATVKKVQSKKSKKLTVTLKKVSGANGYQIQYANNKKFKKAKSKTTTKTTYTVSKLKSGVKYYVRVKAYKTDSTGKKVYSKKWSKAKSTYVR